MKVWENSKQLWKYLPTRARVLTAFLVLPNVHSCFLINSIKNTRNFYRVIVDKGAAIRCICTGHFYRGNLLFCHGKQYLVVLNIPGYIKKITRSAHDIYCGKLQWCLDAQGTYSRQSQYSIWQEHVITNCKVSSQLSYAPNHKLAPEWTTVLSFETVVISLPVY